MISPYKAHLQNFAGQRNELTITRQGAYDITGTVKEVTDFGCIIISDKSQGDSNQVHTFVAFEDIRGVSEEHPHSDLHH